MHSQIVNVDLGQHQEMGSLVKFYPFEERLPAPIVKQRRVQLSRRGKIIFIDVEGFESPFQIIQSTEETAERTMLALSLHYGISPVQLGHTESTNPH